jgi:hypothetical protein
MPLFGREIPGRAYKSGSSSALSIVLGDSSSNDVDTMGTAYKIHAVLLHLSSDEVSGNSLTVKLNNSDHSEQTVLYSKEMSGLSDHVYVLDIRIPSDCTVTVAFTEGDGSTAELEVVYERL